VFDRSYSAARTTYPRVELSAASFERAMSARLVGGVEEEALDAAGVFLTAACLEKLPSALAVLDAEILPAVRQSLERRAGPAVVDDVLQQVRVRLLLGDAPKLALYEGRGPLQGFVRAVASNLLANLQSGEKAEESDDVLALVPDAADVEAGLIRADQQALFKEAFADAVTRLTSRERALLRMSLLDGLSIDEIGPMYGSHRSSVARWLADARQTLGRYTREALAQRLKLTDSEVDSLMQSVQSRFDLSLSRALRETKIK
jgi:RNA polymerase sigma-70 factor (ECF subfamily)